MDDRTFVDILRDRAQQNGDKTAYRFLVDGDQQELTLTYGQLHQRALAIASVLKEEAKPGDRALLLYPPGLEFICAFFGCLYAGVIAVPAYPPGKSRPVQNLKRLELLSRNCAPAVVLCDDDIQAVFVDNITEETRQNVLLELEGQKNQSSLLSLLQARVISTSGLFDIASASESIIVTPSTQDLAFLQYTSGSTGNPKGVMVSHQNLIVNSGYLKTSHNQNSNSIVVSWLPIYHDMGLIGPILQAVYTGCLSILLTPVNFIRNPLLWLKVISSYQGSCSGAPNFAYELCVNRFSEEEMEGVDLSSWKAAYSGAEPIKKGTMESFMQMFEPYGFNRKAFFPVYGMAEHTLLLSAGTFGQLYQSISVDKQSMYAKEAVKKQLTADDQTFVSCGRALESHRVAIVNPDSCQVLQDNQVGEIWCQGSSVAQGYWGNDEATKEIFQAYTVDGQGPFLRTGDLGFLKDGELYIVGRLKDMIIIRGRNYAPQDVEYAVELSHEGIRKGCVAAFSYEEDEVEKLAVVCEIKRTFIKKDHTEIVQAIVENIARENELSVSTIVLLKPGQILKTTSGKIQRHKSKHYQNSDQKVLYRYSQGMKSSSNLVDDIGLSDFQQRLNAIIASVSGQNMTERLDRDVALMDLGLDSLMLVELQNRIEMEFVDDVDIDENSLSAIQRYYELLNYLEENKISVSTMVG